MNIPQFFCITQMEKTNDQSDNKDYWHSFTGNMVNLPLYIDIERQAHDNKINIDIYIPTKSYIPDFIEQRHQISKQHKEINILSAKFKQKEVENIIQQQDPIQQEKELNKLINHYANPLWNERFTHSQKLLQHYIQTHPKMKENALFPPEILNTTNNITNHQQQIWESIQKLEHWCNPHSIILEKENPQSYWTNTTPLITVIQQNIEIYKKQYPECISNEDANVAKSYLRINNAPSIIWPQ